MPTIAGNVELNAYGPFLQGSASRNPLLVANDEQVVDLLAILEGKEGVEVTALDEPVVLAGEPMGTICASIATQGETILVLKVDPRVASNLAVIAACAQRAAVWPSKATRGRIIVPGPRGVL